MKSYLAERKRAQEVIQKSEERLREAQKVAQMGCWELDLTTNALIWSDEVYRIFNINPQEFTGTYKAFLDRIHPNDREFVNKAFAESVNNHTSYDIVHRFLLKDGTLKYVNERCKTFYDETGKPIRSVGTVQDITERVQSRKKIEEALEKAKQGERVKTLFMANMSHEVRTPLNGILGFLELIEAQTRHLLDEEQQGFFDLIRNNGNRLMRTVSEILDISQIEAGTYKGRMHDINLVPLVSMVVREYRMHARQKNLKLEYISDLETAIIYADEYGVFQAISNLLDNAIKYTEKGCVTLSLMKKAKHFILTIQDTGIGMSQEYLDRMFEVFSQESEGYTKKYQGIGLGMAIGKRHLDMNNVDLTVESTKGAGTVFTLTFQEAEDTFIEKDVSKADIEVTPEVESGEKPLVLLVEDDLSSQQLVKAFLKSNYDVCVSTSVKDAKQRLKEYQVNIVLLDLSLEGKEDGLDLVKWMRRTKTWKKTPVIATTAHAFTTDQINCIKAGCNEYLAKPIRRSRLLEKIRIFA
jgi:PAS domain S-box-containing protein